MAWAEKSKQLLLFLKLDFSKAYNIVYWKFDFLTIEKLGLPWKFNHMVKLLFNNTKASIKKNGTLFESFRIKRGMKQGCLFALYLFLIAAKVLNTLIVNEARLELIKDIQLLIG